VWIADDSPLEAELVKRALDGACDVAIFLDGGAVLEQLAAGPLPDALILDWQMPGVSGIDVCQFLRSRPETQALPILMLTIHHEVRDLVEGLAAGADDFLTKPYNAAELCARVSALVRARRVHDRLDLAERSLRALLRHLPEALLTFDFANVVTFANHEAQNMLGAEESELVGRNVADVLPELPLASVAANRTRDLFELADIRRGGRIFAPVIRNVAVRDSRDTAVSFRDVTAQRLTNERRLDLYSIIAHDLRSPLASMMLRIELMTNGRRGPIEPAVAADLKKMKARMGDLVAMVNDFLDLARLDATEMKVSATPLDLCVLAADAVDEFKPLADNKRIVVAVDGEPGDGQVEGDRQRLMQVFSNLLSNAIKFSREGGSVRIAITRDAASVHVAVEDSGPGIAEEALSSLFQRYVRAIDAKHTVAGTGLGLMIIRQIVEAHGGTVGVESQIGRGSTFRFSIPHGPISDRLVPGSGAPSALPITPIPAIPSSSSIPPTPRGIQT
jgi:two-component system phosphate regulon sensor histidine kinase PhoR